MLYAYFKLNFWIAFLFEISKLPDLSWSHYCESLYISDDGKSDFYEKEAIKASWLVRELKRQISISLFERLLLSNGEANKKKVLELALKVNEIVKPEDIVKDYYVFWASRK